MIDAPPVAIVRRQRLIERLHDLVHHRLLMVVAPAGYGKTTMLADFAASCAEGNVALTVCTYTAVSWDADGFGLLTGIAHAFRDQFSGAGEKTLHLLEQARAGAASPDLERLLTSATAVLVQEVEDRVPDYSLLVVDDYHLLDESEAARRLFTLLLERLPAHVHLAVLSRTVPSLDTSALLEAGQVVALGPRDLAFSEAELALFLSRRYGIEAEPALLEEVRRLTEGWITGLLLAMPALPPGLAQAPAAPARRLDMLVRTLSGARRGGVPLNEYLAAEMLRQHAPDDREVLLAAALSEQVDGAQLDEVLERPGSALALARLEQSGVPLTGLPDTPSHFRLHALLRQFLRAHLQRGEPAHHQALCRRWAEVAAAHQQPDVALEHALAGQWWPRAAALLATHGDEWIDRGRHAFVEAALDALPAAVLARHPRVQVCRGRLTYAQGNFPSAVERAREAFFSARTRRDRPAEARALLLEAIATHMSGRATEAYELCLHALEHSAVQRDKLLLAEAYRYLGFVEGTRGFLESAVEHLQQALALYEARGRPWDVARILGNVGVASRQLGRPDAAERCHTRALALRRDLGDPFEISRCLNNLAVLCLYRGALGEAETLLMEAIQLSERAGHTIGVACWQVTLGDVLRVFHRSADALRSYRAARAFTGRAVDPRWTAWSHLGEAGVHLNDGAFDEVESAARQALHIGSRAGLREIEGHARALLAAAAVCQGQRREANRRLDAARLTARETGGKELQARVYLWTGLNALAQKRPTAAGAALQLAVDAAQALGGPTVLALEGQAMAPLLRLGVTRNIAPDLVSRALDLLSGVRAAEVREHRAGAGHLTSPDAAAPLPPLVRIRLLGDFAVELNGVSVEDGLSARSRTRELLAYLAVFPDGRRREEITADLWPEAQAGQEKTLIQITIHRLRRALFHELLVATEGGPYLLDPAVRLEVDVRRFQEHIAAARAAGLSETDRHGLLVAAVEAYAGPFLPASYAEWTELLRRRLERDYVTALAQLIKVEWDLRAYRQCLAWCHRLIEAEPYDESIHARIIECYTRLGEPLSATLHRRRRESQDSDITRNQV